MEKKELEWGRYILVGGGRCLNLNLLLCPFMNVLGFETGIVWKMGAQELKLKLLNSRFSNGWLKRLFIASLLSNNNTIYTPSFLLNRSHG